MIDEAGGDLFQWFRSFYFVATSGSFTRAAELLHRNQSAVTYQIKSLESERGVTLIHRLKNSIELTADGEILFKWVLRTFDAISGMRQELAWRDRRGACRVGASRPTLISEPFVTSLLTFHSEWPNMKIYLNNSNPHRIYNDIATGQIDFGVYAGARVSLELQAEQLFLSPCLLVVSKKLERRLDRRPTPAQLADIPYIPLNIDQSGLPVRQTFMPVELSHIFQNLSWLSCISYQVIFKYLTLCEGCTVIDAWSMTALQEYVAEFSFYPLDHLVPPVEYALLTRPGYTPGPAISHFRDMLVKNFSQVSLELEIEKLCAK